MDEIRFHPEARDEYQSALEWYLARSPQAAARFEVEADHVLAMIAANPLRFPLYDDAHRYVMFRKYPYSMVYQTHRDHVEVVAVAHSGREAGYWRRRN